MKQFIILLFTFLAVGSIFGQNNTQNAIVKTEGAQNSWNKGENDANGANSQTSGTENVTFNATSEGIFVTILSGTNKIKLFALTGQLLLNGELKQGTFFIPTRKGIYFLKVNNKSFKVICK